jgi:hyperosmotically inducible periplasmic protein
MKTRKNVVMLLAALALLALSVPAFASKMDKRIEASARQSYVFKTYLQGDEITIESRDGAVTLTGLVSDRSHKALARDTVVGLPGVRSVEDRLEVKGTPPTDNSDAWIRDRVKMTLLFHKSVRGKGTEVAVKDGIVTLNGTADSMAQKELTTEYTKDIDGVVEVHNELSVIEAPQVGRTTGEKIDDASITSQVKLTLLYHRSSSAINTKVVTKRGVVTLTGTATSTAQMILAGKLAGDVSGVKEVRNRMTVE